MSSSLEVLDWRRRVFALYAEVRATGAPQAAHETWRQGRDELFATHPASPLTAEDRERFTGLPIAPYDPRWRFACTVDRDTPRHRLEVPSGTDGIVPFERAGRVELPGLGSLDVWWLASYGGGVFLPLKDATAGETTYGGGRYLLDTVKGADLGGDVRDGLLVVDLNFAYNPSCAYDPAWACPLAPAGNTLDVEVAAGELAATSDED
ncbi:MAG: DUF1684 domain-containing protein [Actinomycetota bacterium]|nr:DUF1684 domain-containing protein [Actinomycetota bacterium]